MNSQEIRHLVIIEDPRGKRKIELKDPVYSIGRHSSNSIVVASRQVSRFHATILKKKSESEQYTFWIIDGNLKGQKSQNGIFVNGQRCWVRELKHGDVINFCDVKATYYLLAPAENTFFQNPQEEEDIEVIFSSDLQTTPALISEINLEASTELSKLASFPKLAPYPIIELDFSGKITYINPAAKEQFQDIEESQVEHPLLLDLLTPPFNDFSRQVTIGEQIFEEYIHYLPENKLVRIYAFNVSERPKNPENINLYDKETGFPNPILFNEHLSFALTNAKTHHYLMALILIEINENLTQKILQEIAKVLRNCCREGDIFARLEEQNFALLLPQISSVEYIGKINKKILQQFSKPLAVEQHKINLTTNIGIAVYPQDGEEVETILKAANTAVFRSKKQGKNNYQYYNRKFNLEESQLSQLENELSQALKKEEFLLHYQPQFDLNTGDICGLEALLRWKHPEKGLISPLEFIPQAEKIGLIVSIGQWVLQTAAAQNKAWQNAGLRPIKMAVNIGKNQFYQWNLLNTVSQILKQTRLEPQWLELEITEVTIRQNWESVRQTIPALLQMGVHLCLDDFGIGYSSIGYLKQFKFHTLKIAQTFIEELQDNPQDKAIVSTAIALGNGFNLRVIAEGVETPEQLEILRSLHCSQVQGYLFSPPLPAEEITEILTAYSTDISTDISTEYFDI